MPPKLNPYVKAVTASNPPKPSSAKKDKPAPRPKGSLDAHSLRDAVKALGGDEDDVKLLLDAGESDSEMEEEETQGGKNEVSEQQKGGSARADQLGGRFRLTSRDWWN